MTLAADIWASFRRLPIWVQIWVALILVPVNMASLAFIGQGNGGWIAALAVGGMLPNLWLMIRERGLSKAMALSHVALWTPMLVLIWRAMFAATILSDGFVQFLWVLLIIDGISLVFDYPDAVKWWKGDRAVA